MNIYTIKIRRYKKGQAGSSRYRFSLGAFAKPFAIGYQAALRDVGITDLYVSVVDKDGDVMLDGSEIQRILERIVIR